MDDEEQNITVYPCVMYRLDEVKNPDSFKRGFRFRVEDIDGDTWYFRDQPRMLEQLQIHAMVAVKPEEMEKLRANRLKKK